MAKVSKAALRMLRRISDAEEKGYDGIAPHGSAEWATMRALNRERLVEYSGEGICSGDCDNQRHSRESVDVAVFHILPAGMALLGVATREG